MRELTLHNLINRVDELPEVPQTAFRAIQLLNNPDTAVSNLAEVISSDQALTAKLLRLCNSAFYGLERKVTTISEAVIIVGFSSIKSLVLMITTQSTLNKGLLGYKMGPGEFWRHSLGTAEASRCLALHIGHEKPEECFIAGLIHDIGKMVLNQYALPEVYRATNLHQKERIPLHMAEQRILGFDHAQVGGALAERWNFPPILVESIQRHHSMETYMEQGKIITLPTLIGVADLVSKAVEHEDSYVWADLQSHSHILQNVLNLNLEEIKALLPSIKTKIEETSELIMHLN